MKTVPDSRNNISWLITSWILIYIPSNGETLQSHLICFHFHMTWVKHETLPITLPVHIFLTLQLEGKLA